MFSVANRQNADDGNAPLTVDELVARYEQADATVAVIGLGYVGLPLVSLISHAGFTVIGLDIDQKKIHSLQANKTYIKHIPARMIKDMNDTGRFSASSDFSHLARADVIIICVPSPLTKQREPDMSYIVNTANVIAKHLRRGQLISLESTTYPGTTREIVSDTLERETGLKSGEDFFVVFSPEREDPGNEDYSTATTPKVVGGHGEAALKLGCAIYGKIASRVVPVSNVDTAEAVKLTENIFRAVNIALVNELKVIYENMGIDVWEVIDAAKTKPFGFMPFYPGPGLGGHCIPIDPFYLTWKAREFDSQTRFIELAGEINTNITRHVVQRFITALNDRLSKSLKGSKILLLGLAYKKNVDDVRESPSLRIIEMLEEGGAQVAYHDPHVPVIPDLHRAHHLQGRESQALTAALLQSFDAVFVATDHDDVNYALVLDNSRLILDTRNVFGRQNLKSDKIVKA